MKCCFKSQRGRFLFAESTHISVSLNRRDLTFFKMHDIWERHTERREAKIAVKPPPPPLQRDLSSICTQSPPDPCHMSHSLSRTQKSRALCSVASEVQMVCLYASLTQRCSFTSSLLCLLLLDSVHQRSTRVTPLSSLHSCPGVLFLVSLSPVHHPFHFSDSWFVCSPLPQLRGRRSHVLMNEQSCYIVRSHPCPCSIMAQLILSYRCSVERRRLRAGSRAVIIKSVSTVKPQSIQVIKTLQLGVTSSQSLLFFCPTFWL